MIRFNNLLVRYKFYLLLWGFLFLLNCQLFKKSQSFERLKNIEKYYNYSNLNKIFRFSKAKIPIPFDIKKDSIVIDKKKITTSRQCGKCHKTAYANWSKSRHKVAFTNKLYKESHRKEPHIWCVNCHAPLHEVGTGINDMRSRIQKEDGVSCIVCHVREKKIITASIPQKKPGKTYAHKYEIIPQMKEAKFCGECHQFNFPTAASARNARGIIKYTNQVMQNTLNEYLTSGFIDRSNCQDCHLQPRSRNSHLFNGGHDIELLKKSLFVSIKKIKTSDDLYKLTVYSMGIGHAFPTGDLFRTLKVRVLDNKKKVTIANFILRKDYRNFTSDEQDDEKPAKYLFKDGSILEPVGNEIASSRIFYFRYAVKLTKVLVEMHIDYLHDVSNLISTMSLKTTRPLIKKEFIAVE